MGGGSIPVLPECPLLHSRFVALLDDKKGEVVRKQAPAKRARLKMRA
jgi:hypothetical protein